MNKEAEVGPFKKIMFIRHDCSNVKRPELAFFHFEIHQKSQIKIEVPKLNNLLR